MDTSQQVNPSGAIHNSESPSRRKRGLKGLFKRSSNSSDGDKKTSKPNFLKRVSSQIGTQWSPDELPYLHSARHHNVQSRPQQANKTTAATSAPDSQSSRRKSKLSVLWRPLKKAWKGMRKLFKSKATDEALEESKKEFSHLRVAHEINVQSPPRTATRATGNTSPPIDGGLCNQYSRMNITGSELTSISTESYEREAGATPKTQKWDPIG